MKLEVTTAKSTQSEIPELGKKEKILYYLLIGEVGKGAVQMNVGEKTYKQVSELLKPRETSTTINVLPEEKYKK